MKTDLTQERVRELFDYDAETGILMRKLKSGRWKVCGDKPTLNDEYGQAYIDGKNYLAHRLIWLWHYGEWPEHDIDHLDRNPMNNRINNLRAATRTENLHNLGIYKNNSSGYPGVSFFGRYNKYVINIRLNGKLIFIGYFDTPEEAFVAYMVAKIEYHPTSPIAQEYLRELTLAG